MKRIAAMAAFILFIMVPSGFAQIVAVSDFSPVDVGYGDSSGGSGPHCNFLNGTCSSYQAFSLASGVYMDGIKIGVVELPNLVGGDIFFKITIWSGSIGGPEVFSVAEPFIGFPSVTSDQVVSLTIDLTPISKWLPAGNYFIGLQGGVISGCTVPGAVLSCGLEWAPNQNGSPQVGIVGQGFYNDPSTTAGTVPLAPLAGTNGTFAFQIFTKRVKGRPHGGAFGQIIRLVAGPVIPAPGSPVEAQLAFLDMNGNPIGPSSSVTINAGETQSLDLNVSQFVAQLGQRIEVQPVITVMPNAAGGPVAPAQVSGAVQVLDAVSGFGSVLNPLPQPGASSPLLVSQVLAGGQTMRFNVVGGDQDSCSGQLSFADKGGSPLGPSLQLNLAPGMGTSLDLNADTLGLKLGQRIEVQPIITVSSPAAGAVLNSVCQTSVEVFDHLTGRTSTYQSSSAALP